MTDGVPLALDVRGITKTYAGGVTANSDITLSFGAGAIHALVGENGAGKSTFVNILYGRIKPDSGEIRVNGDLVSFTGPHDAIRRGLGLVTQQTTIIPALTTLENAILGVEPVGRGNLIDRESAREKLQSIELALGFQFDWGRTGNQLTIAEMQKLEIVKALYRGASLLMLDEPTSALAPLEAETLFGVLHTLAAQGTTILLVTHKMREVTAHTSTVSVLRAGRLVGSLATRDASSANILTMALGSVPAIRVESSLVARPAASVENGASPLLELDSVYTRSSTGAISLRNVSLQLAAGEILGVAGVDGSGQRELGEAIVGLKLFASGDIRLAGSSITGLSVAERHRLGIHSICEDRARGGLIPTFSVAENLMLGLHRTKPWARRGVLMRKADTSNALSAINQFAIKAPSPHTVISQLSGGNQQKVIIARALQNSPRVIVAAQPTRGLDSVAALHVYESLRHACSLGAGVLLLSLDLGELMEWCDRILVVYNGTIVCTELRCEFDAGRIGSRMMQG